VAATGHSGVEQAVQLLNEAQAVAADIHPEVKLEHSVDLHGQHPRSAQRLGGAHTMGVSQYIMICTVLPHTQRHRSRQ
jgi:hypothetical protein